MKISEQLRIRSKVNTSLRKLLLLLSSGKAFTTIELSRFAKTSIPRTEEILKDLTGMDIVATRKSRNRIYYFIPAPNRIDYIKTLSSKNSKTLPKGMKYSRHCYKHLAGFVGVKVEEALVAHNYIIPENIQNDYGIYKITPEGWKWFSKFDIEKNEIERKGGRLTKQCLDFSERKSHLGGKLGDALLDGFLKKGWFIQVPNSREVKLTDIGKTQLLKELDIDFDRIEVI